MARGCGIQALESNFFSYTSRGRFFKFQNRDKISQNAEWQPVPGHHNLSCPLCSSNVCGKSKGRCRRNIRFNDYEVSTFNAALKLFSHSVRYVPALQGVVLSHSNLRFLNNTATIRGDSPFLTCTVVFDATVWSPRVGIKLCTFLFFLQHPTLI